MSLSLRLQSSLFAPRHFFPSVEVEQEETDVFAG